jgi:hypothetical protein
MDYDNPNRPTRTAVLRPEKDMRDLNSPATGNTMLDGYTVYSRRPRVPGYPDYVSPDRAEGIEDIVRQYDGPMMPDGDGDYDD